VLLRAFWDAFTAQDDVSLFVRTSMDGRATEELKVRLVQANHAAMHESAAVSRLKTAAEPAACAERRLSALLPRQKFRERYLNETDRTPAQLPQTVAPPAPTALPGSPPPALPPLPGAPPGSPSREPLPGARLRAPSWHDSVPSPRRSLSGPVGARPNQTRLHVRTHTPDDGRAPAPAHAHALGAQARARACGGA
jgi:hypothetical protein